MRCVFCDLILDGAVVPGSRNTFHFEPLNPVVEGHRLFIPKLHATRATTYPSITGDVFAAAAQYASMQLEDFNLIVNSGADAGQTVFHLHVHYVPRRAEDGLIMPWTEQLELLKTQQGDQIEVTYMKKSGFDSQARVSKTTGVGADKNTNCPVQVKFNNLLGIHIQTDEWEWIHEGREVFRRKDDSRIKYTAV